MIWILLCLLHYRAVGPEHCRIVLSPIHIQAPKIPARPLGG
jgi:hypothetical protein